MANFPRIKNHELLSQKVYRIIKKDIIQGKLVSDTRLFEEKIAAQMNISRTPIREALRLLAAEGFVKLIPNIGIVVNQVSPQDLLDVLNIRLQLEVYAVSLATQKFTEKDIKNLSIIIEQMEEAVFANDALSYSNLNSKYHKNIINISENKKLIEICDNLYQQSEHWIKALGVSERLRHSLQEHKDIFDAVKAKDPDRAKQAMHIHLHHVITNVYQNGLKGDKETNEKD
ncbi:MAG: GntR family transcriptional regulator [Atribacterota bacterium]|nr:GntR family transcriptional regulator [Atribacterota bacterium]